MEPPTLNGETTTDDNVDFSRVTVVARRWMLDFLFVSLCRYFKDGNLDEFSRTLAAFEAMTQGCTLRAEQAHKTKMAAFLARIIHGKKLDVVFEDEGVMPLMSAINIWPTLRETVADESLAEKISTLLFVQAVAVCLEKGQRSMAASALKWLEENHVIPQNLAVKLSTMVTKRDTYHPFLLNFNYERLLDTVQTYLDAFLVEYPSDFLLQAATKVLQSSPIEESSEESSRGEALSQSSEQSQDNFKGNETTTSLRSKRKLLSIKNPEPWKPESCKKPKSKILPGNMAFWKSGGELSEKSLPARKIRSERRKWTYQLDQNLKEGVRRHGEGKWSRILLDFDFEGRTGIMLKDRWRVLKRSFKVS